MDVKRPYLKTARRFHFIGIGGIGMSGIAHLLLELGYRVTGSDLKLTAITERLMSMGATIFPDHRASHVDSAEVAVVSSAVPPDNPELVSAQARGIPLAHRSEMLAELMDRQLGIAVAGTHGKSTTTSMAGVIFRRGGADPTVVIGGELNDIGGNATLGKGAHFIAEADESDGSFLNLRPRLAVVTNIESDHLDHYGSQADLVRTFAEFLRKLPSDGRAVVCGDCAQAVEASQFLNGRRITYGFSPDCDLRGTDVQPEGCHIRFRASRNGQSLGDFRLGVPGRQNVQNALAALAVGLDAGIPLEAIREALSEFSGIGRRFQRLGEVHGVEIIDDYAHHPSEVRATLRAAREAFPDRRLVCAFQPHRYSRTQLLGKTFGDAFKEADAVIITDVYAAGEAPIAGVSGKLIADAVRLAEPDKVLQYVADCEAAAEALRQLAQPGTVCLTLGAGSINDAAFQLARELKAP